MNMSNDQSKTPEWTKQNLADWPRLPPTKGRPENRWMLILLATIGGGIFGQDVANNIVGEVGWRDEFVGLMFALAGGQFGALVSRRLCKFDKKSVANGVGGAASTGATVGLGGAALTAAGLSWLDGGIITGSIILFTVGKLAYNRFWGGAKTCPYPRCKARQSCEFAVCRKCLRIIYPTSADCENATNRENAPDLEWLDVASMLQARRLNYLESLELVKDHWDVKIHGDPKSPNSTVACEDFMRWLNDNKEHIRKYRDTIKPSEKSDKMLEELRL